MAFRGKSLGPHGCGKTTLTMTLEPSLRSQFSMIKRITIRKDGAVSGEIRPKGNQNLNQTTLFVIDGIENLGWLQRKIFVKFIKRSAEGLLLTTHRAIKGIPVIYQITPNFQIFSKIVSQISPNQQIDQQRLEQIFAQNKLSTRESLMSL